MIAKDIIIEACARAAHEVNRAYCIAMGDYSQSPWEQAPDWQTQSARNGVRGVLEGNTPEQSHQSWLEEKRRNGWRYGAVKNVETKEHPCFLPYDQLPEAQQVKDDLFVVTVSAVFGALMKL